MRIGIDFSGTEIWYRLQKVQMFYSVQETVLTCLLFYCFKMNWGSSVEKLIGVISGYFTLFRIILGYCRTQVALAP